MPAPYQFPDPRDCSPNEPSVIVSSKKVIGIYNQFTGDDMQSVTGKVQEWFMTKAYEKGWAVAKFSGNQCFLEADFKKMFSEK